MLDYVAAIERETRRIVEVAARTDLDVPVPSCPGWALADLVRHLAEVQHFWGAIVGERLAGPESYAEPERPSDDLVVSALDTARARLLAALAAVRPEAPCWTWHDPDQTVGFVRRRQAHEALIHRIDAELAAGDLTAVDAALAADGADEIVTIMLTGVPPWAEFTPHGSTIQLEATDAGRAWSIELGRMRGTSPASGRFYDLDAGELSTGGSPPDAVVSGSAADLDLWLWGRGLLERLSVTGDRALAGWLRRLAADATQ